MTGLSLGQVVAGIFVKEGLRCMAVGRMLHSAAIGHVDVVYFPGMQFRRPERTKRPAMTHETD